MIIKPEDTVRAFAWNKFNNWSHSARAAGDTEKADAFQQCADWIAPQHEEHLMTTRCADDTCMKGPHCSCFQAEYSCNVNDPCCAHEAQHQEPEITTMEVVLGGHDPLALSDPLL